MGLFGIPSEAKGIFPYQSEEHLDTTQVMTFFFSRTFQKAQRSKGLNVSTESTIQSLTFFRYGRGVPNSAKAFLAGRFSIEGVGGGRPP